MRSAFAQRPTDEPNGGVQPALAVVTMQAGGRNGALQLFEREGPADGHAPGEAVAIGDSIGLLSYPTGESSGGPFSTLIFEGCGLHLGLSAFNLDGVPPFSAEDLIAVADATGDSCAPRSADGLPGHTRYFVIERDDAVPDLEAFEARLGFDVVLPSYLPAGVTPSFIFGQLLVPGAVGEPDFRSVQVAYGINSGALVLIQTTRPTDLGEGEAVRVGNVAGRLSRGDAIDGDPEIVLRWRACGLAFSLTETGSAAPGAPAARTVTDDELMRMAASIVEGCE